MMNFQVLVADINIGYEEIVNIQVTMITTESIFMVWDLFSQVIIYTPYQKRVFFLTVSIALHRFISWMMLIRIGCLQLLLYILAKLTAISSILFEIGGNKSQEGTNNIGS